MRSRKDHIKKTVSINCPVCYSGNYFQLAQLDRELACSDCTFILTDVPVLETIDSGRCIFCSSQHFYFESPFCLRFLGRSTVCYLCEAQYKGVTINEPDENYNEDVATDVQESEAAVKLKERVEGYS
jgi:hypothetical protein